MGWSIADVFVGGVIYTRSAWVMDLSGPLAWVRAGRKTEPFPLGLLFPYYLI
jgi:hypothetical protein